MRDVAGRRIAAEDPSGPRQGARGLAVAKRVGFGAARHLGVAGIAFAGASVAYQASRVGLNLVAALTLGPEMFGVWVLIQLVVQYSNFLSFGTTSGANREIPYLRGAGQTERADYVHRVAVAATLATGALAACLVLVAAPWLVPLTPPLRDDVAALLAAAVFLQQLFILQQVFFLANFRLGSAAVQYSILATVVLAFGLPMTLAFGLPGLMVAQIATFVVALAVGQVLLRHTPRFPAFDIPAVRHLAAVGLPIMTAGLLFGILTTIDRWIVLSLLGLKAVGYYGIVGTVISGLLLIPSVLGQQFYPKIAYAYGRNEPRAALLQLAREQNLIAASIMAAAGLAVSVAAMLGIPRFLPAYTPAVSPLLLAVAGLVTYGASCGYGNILNAVRAHRLYLSVQAIAVLVNFSLCIILGGVARLGLVGIAAGVSSSMALYSVMLWIAAHVATNPPAGLSPSARGRAHSAPIGVPPEESAPTDTRQTSGSQGQLTDIVAIVPAPSRSLASSPSLGQSPSESTSAEQR